MFLHTLQAIYNYIFHLTVHLISWLSIYLLSYTLTNQQSLVLFLFVHSVIFGPAATQPMLASVSSQQSQGNTGSYNNPRH